MTDTEGSSLRAERLTFGFSNRPDFLKPVSLDMAAGECWGIIGPNGAGKSTLLRLLAGLLQPASGAVLLRGRPLVEFSAQSRARSMAFLPQQVPNDLATCSGDVVLMGRHPHRRFGLFEDSADRAIARRVMSATQTWELAERSLCTLSGGEARRVHIAAALAQEPSIFLLDEPTASLDLHHELSIFEILNRLAVEDRLLVIVVTHDINLAARFCSHLVLLDDGVCVSVGAPKDVMRPDVLEAVYDVSLKSVTSDHVGGQWWVPWRPQQGESPRAGDPASPSRDKDMP
ncbi:MAG: ABC transporter ATP-binding protein [Phycisphaerae bacterium]